VGDKIKSKSLSCSSWFEASKEASFLLSRENYVMTCDMLLRVDPY
jgi:hypothetical protein